MLMPRLGPPPHPCRGMVVQYNIYCDDADTTVYEVRPSLPPPASSALPGPTTQPQLRKRGVRRPRPTDAICSPGVCLSVWSQMKRAKQNALQRMGLA